MLAKLGITRSIVGVLVMCSVIGCAGLHGRRHGRYTSSVVEYLYPGTAKAEVATIPRLALPISVGVAFVPEATGRRALKRLGEKEKMDLMVRISTQFRSLPFVRDIELIPTAYLTNHGGFRNLDQIRTMYGIDAIALLSYDQVQHTDTGLLSLSYWTIVGAYIIRGERNDTSTLMDAAVYDIPSRKMLFRAPGTSQVKASSTLVNLSEQLRGDSSSGFRLAADDLVANLQDELDRFKKKVKEMPEAYAVRHKPGYTGGGSLGGTYAVALLVLGGLGLWLGGRERRNSGDR